MLSDSRIRVIDLTLPLREGVRGFARTQNTTIAAEGFNTTNLRIHSHAGTHMDAPSHFVPDGFGVERISLERCVGPALVVDLSDKAPNSFISVADLSPCAKDIAPGSRLLLRTDWDRFARRENYYRAEMPRVSAELARWLVERKIALLGLETPSVASLRPENRAELTEVHRILLEPGTVIVESLANLRKLRQQSFFAALPLNIDGCDGSPVRAVAIED